MLLLMSWRTLSKLGIVTARSMRLVTILRIHKCWWYWYHDDSIDDDSIDDDRYRWCGTSIEVTVPVSGATIQPLADHHCQQLLLVGVSKVQALLVAIPIKSLLTVLEKVSQYWTAPLKWWFTTPLVFDWTVAKIWRTTTHCLSSMRHC